MAMITSLSDASGATQGTPRGRAWPGAPKAAGCGPTGRRDGSGRIPRGVKRRAHISAMASASPSARAATALAVGARLCGSASRSTEASSSTSTCAASGERWLPRMPISGEWKSRSSGTSASNSAELPFFETSTRGIAGRVDAQIAVHRFGRMQEDGGRAGAAQRGHDLARDVARFADAGDHHLARMRQYQLHGANQLASRRAGGAAQRAASISMAVRAAASHSCLGSTEDIGSLYHRTATERLAGQNHRRQDRRRYAGRSPGGCISF